MADEGAPKERHKVTYDLAPMEEGHHSVLDDEREKHRLRAEKFGVAYKDPARSRKDMVLEAKRERLARPGFATGFDFFSEEEVARRAARAKKFGLATAAPTAGATAAAAGEQAAGSEDDPAALAALGRPEAARKAAEELEKLRKKQERAERFKVEYDAKKDVDKLLLMDEDLFEHRAEAPLDVPRRNLAIYLYGVDYMSTGDVLSYFDDYGPCMVEWINDSACAVVFADAASTLRALAGRGQPIPIDIAAPPAGEEGVPAPDLSDLSTTDPHSLPYLWFKGADFLLHGTTPIKLIYRMATDLDQRETHADKRSRFLWQKQQRGRGGSSGSGKKRSRQRHHHQQHGYGGEEGAEGMEWDGDYGEGGYGYGMEQQQYYDQGDYDNGMGQQQQYGEGGGRRMRGPRGGRKVQRKRQRAADGSWQEVEMEDAEALEEGEGPAPGQQRLRSTITLVAGPAVDGEPDGGAAADAAPIDPDVDLRQQLLQRQKRPGLVTRQTADSDVEYEEVEQPDDEG